MNTLYFPTAEKSRAGTILLVLCAVATSLYLWSPGLSAGWWIIDDHEIHRFIGPGERMPISQLLPNLIDKTEVGEPGTAVRYRPGYYMAYLLECALWGKHPGLWYGFRLVAFFISLVIFALLFERIIGVPMAALLAALVLCNSYWADIFARLGPGEFYCVSGLALYCLAFVAVRRLLLHPDSGNAWRLPAWTAVLCLASLLTAGSKENFTLLAIPSAYLLVLAVRFRPVGLPTILAMCGLVVNLLIPVAIGVVVAMGLANAGSDVYGNSVGLGVRLMLLRRFFRHASASDFFAIVVPMLATALALASRWLGLDQKRTRMLRWGAITQLALLAVYVSQYLFYNGVWPTGTRYDFPGQMIPAVMLVVAIRILRRVLAEKFESGVQLAGCLLLGGLLLYHARDLVMIRTLSQENASRTRNFTGQIEKLVREVSTAPDRPVVFESHTVGDFEPAISVRRFLEAARVRNPVQLRIIGFSGALYPPGSFNRSIAEQMEKISIEGDTAFGFAPYVPGEADIFTVGLSGEPSEGTHVALGRIN